MINFLVKNSHLSHAEGVGATWVGRVDESIPAGSKYLTSNGLDVNSEAGIDFKKPTARIRSTQNGLGNREVFKILN